MTARIVVLDQDQALHAQYRTLLEGEGYEVKCYTSLPDPRTILIQRPSLILLDYFVGTIAYGWIWLITLRTYDEDDLPVLVCAADGHSLRSHAQDLHDLQARLLPKPFSAQDLIQAVRKHAIDMPGVAAPAY